MRPNISTIGSRAFFQAGLRAWDRWVLRHGPPHVLALLRILLGLWLLLYWAPLIPHVPILFSSSGLAIALPPESVPSVGVAWLLFSLLLLFLLSFTLGFCMRIAGIGALLVLSELYVTSFHLTWFTFEHLSFFLLLVLSLSGADRTMSLRMLWRRGSFLAWEPICLLPQRIIAFQITATFLGAGWQKLFLPDWQSGEIIAFSLIGRWATPLAFSIAQLGLPIEFYDAVTYLMTMFEFFLPLGLWVPSQRLFWICGMFLFLLVVTLLFGFYWFLILAPASLAFYEPEGIHRALQKRRLLPAL